MTMYAEERQQAMAQLVAERGRVSVAEISEQFDVTTETVRRDLSVLERIGLLRRVHGGAVPATALAARLAGSPQVELHLLPGRVRSTTQAAVGAETVEAVHRLRTDVAFVGTNALSIDHGLSTPDHEEAATKRAMVSSARRIVCLADSSKVGRESPVRFAEIGEVDVLVTDDGISAADRRACERAGVEVVVA